MKTTLQKIEDLRREIDILNSKRCHMEVDGPQWKRNKKKADALLAKLIELKQKERMVPLMKTKGTEVFHVLTKEDLEKIWAVLGIKRHLVRVNNMPTAKYKVIGDNGISIYFDVFPSMIAYATRKEE